MRLSIQEKNKYEKCDDVDSVASNESWPRLWSLTLCNTTLVSRIGKPVKAIIKFDALKSKLAKSWALFTNSGMFAKKWRSLQKINHTNNCEIHDQLSLIAIIVANAENHTLSYGR